jgi:hypothetical protein
MGDGHEQTLMACHQGLRLPGRVLNMTQTHAPSLGDLPSSAVPRREG